MLYSHRTYTDIIPTIRSSVAHPWNVFKSNSEPLHCRFRCHSLKDSIDVFLWLLVTGWFDHGWIYSVPPPNVPINDTRSYGKNPGDWEGLSSEVWGSHLYYNTMRRFNNGSSRPLALSRNGGGNWRAGMSSESVAGVAAHHRYPVCESYPDRSTATAVLLSLKIGSALHVFDGRSPLPCLSRAP